MHRKARILKDRIEAVAVGRRIKQAGERIRRRHDEEQKSQSDHSVDAKHLGLKSIRKIVAKHGNGRAEQG